MADVDVLALAVSMAARRVRKFGFAGRSPHLRRELPDGALQLVHFQRSVSGATGRDPAFTVNLNVVPGAMLRQWQEAGDWRASEPIRSGADVGYYKRLGQLAYGHDHWWTPTNEADARRAADEVAELVATVDSDWLANPTE